MYKNFILQYPNRHLKHVCEKVIDFKEAKEIASKLIEVTQKVDGPLKIWLGMAANQIGYDKRIVILRKRKGSYTVMVNPEIIEQKWNLPIFSQCYSVDGLYIRRCPYWTKVQYQDLDGKEHIEIIKGGKSATLHQEIEHINGILISDIGKRIL